MADYRLLSQALSQLLACREGLTQALAQVRNLDDFSRPLLQQALARFGTLDADRVCLRQWYFTSPTISYVTGRLPVADSDYYDTPLLEAALNLTEAEQHDQPAKLPGGCAGRHAY